MAKISIIVTVYNIERYIGRCLDSIVNQSFDDIQIIVINDGSTDYSQKVIESFSTKDSRILCINKKNEGVVYAREVGLQQANGDYILHVDGDDYLEQDAIEIAYSSIKTSKADLCIFNFWFRYSDRTEHSNLYPKNHYNNIELLEHIWKGYGYCAPWSYICKRELYKKVHFDRYLSFGEDAYMTSQLIYFSKKIEIIDSKPILNYIIRPKSLSNKALTKKTAEGMEKYPEMIKSFMTDKPEYDTLKESLEAIKIISFCTLLHRGWLDGVVRRSKETMKILRVYPNLIYLSPMWHLRKAVKLLSINYFCGLLFIKYYKLKGKII